MRSSKLTLPCLTVIAFAAVFASTAGATCNPSKAPQFRAANRALPFVSMKSLAPVIRAADANPAATEPSIVGYWYVRFVADGQLVDDGFDMWHSDGTEVLNDTTAPSTGNVCLGVWAKTAPFTYTLKHPSWIFDSAGVNVVGVVIIREQITLDPSGDSFKGLTTFDAYDLSGNPLDHESSEITGQRISPVDAAAANNAPPGIPGLPPTILDR